MLNLNDAIRERAYHLWVSDGRQDGKADAYWLAAQRDLLAASVVDKTEFEPIARVAPTVSEAKLPAKKAKPSSPRKGKRRAA